MWHMTCDMWHLTCDTWHVTRDRWEEVNLLSNSSSLALPAWELKVTCDTWHVTPDMWHLTPDIWHVSHNTQGAMNIVSTFLLSSSYCLGDTVYRRYFHKWWVRWTTKLFGKQHRLHQACDDKKLQSHYLNFKSALVPTNPFVAAALLQKLLTTPWQARWPLISN